MRRILIPLFMLACCSFAFPQSTTASKSKKAKIEMVQCGGTGTVKNGESQTNKDGVTVDNDSKTKSSATIDPKDGCGNPKSKTKVKSKARFEGKISGIDSNDTVELSSSNTVTVSGTGGSVKISGGSTVTVMNTGGAGSSIQVSLPSGTTAMIRAGSTITFRT